MPPNQALQRTGSVCGFTVLSPVPAASSLWPAAEHFFVRPHQVEDDWRLQGQEEYLKSKPLTWQLWTETRAGWDHDHCEFCGTKIWDRPSDPADQAAGYCDHEHRHWVCRQCALDFAFRFDLKLIGGPVTT